MKPIAFGIDFGTTNSIAAAWGESIRLARQADQPLVFWHQDHLGHDRPLPSVVWYRPDTQPVVGFQARQNIQAFQGGFLQRISSVIVDTDAFHSSVYFQVDLCLNAHLPGNGIDLFQSFQTSGKRMIFLLRPTPRLRSLHRT